MVRSIARLEKVVGFGTLTCKGLLFLDAVGLEGGRERGKVRRGVRVIP